MEISYGLALACTKMTVGGEGFFNNEPLPDGVYNYLLELDTNFATTKTGFIQIMRQ